MGHTLPSVLPRTKSWDRVVDLLAAGAPSEDVVSATVIAAERELSTATDDPRFVDAVWLLAALPMAARAESFGPALRDMGVRTGDAPNLLELTAAIGDWLDLRASKGEASADSGELARQALLTSLSRQIGERLPGSLEATPDEVRQASARMASPSEFSRLARGFFTDLLGRTLGYWLDRTLSTHVGPGRRFAHAGDRAAFDATLQQYCLEATRIIGEFSAGWYSRRFRQEIPVSRRDAAGFGAIAFRKISSELRLQRGGNV